MLLTPFITPFLEKFNSFVNMQQVSWCLKTINNASKLLTDFWTHHQSIQHQEVIDAVALSCDYMLGMLRTARVNNMHLPDEMHEHMDTLAHPRSGAEWLRHRCEHYSTLPISTYNKGVKEQFGERILHCNDNDYMFLRLMDIAYTMSTNFTTMIVNKLKEELGDDGIVFLNKKIIYSCSYYPDDEHYMLPPWLWNILPRNPTDDQVDAVAMEACDTGQYVGRAVPAYWTIEYLVKGYREYFSTMAKRKDGQRGKYEREYGKTKQDFEDMRRKCDFILKDNKPFDLRKNAVTWYDYYTAIQYIQDILLFWPDEKEHVTPTVERFTVIKEAYIFCPVPKFYMEVEEIKLPRAEIFEDGSRTILDDGDLLYTKHQSPATDWSFLAYHEYVERKGIAERLRYLPREWLVKVVRESLRFRGDSSGITFLTVNDNSFDSCGFGLRTFMNVAMTEKLLDDDKLTLLAHYDCDPCNLGIPCFANAGGCLVHSIYEDLKVKLGKGFKEIAAASRRLDNMGFNPLETYSCHEEELRNVLDALDQYSLSLPDSSVSRQAEELFFISIGGFDKGSPGVKANVDTLVEFVRSKPHVNRWLRILVGGRKTGEPFEDDARIVAVNDDEYEEHLVADINDYIERCFAFKDGRLEEAVSKALEGTAGSVKLLKKKVCIASEGNLLYVVTLLHFVQVISLNRRDLDTQKELLRLFNLLDASDDGMLEKSKLNRLYVFLFSNYLHEHFGKYYKPILQTIVTAFEPLHLRELYDVIMNSMEEDTFDRTTDLNDMCEAQGRITWRDFVACMNSLRPFVMDAKGVGCSLVSMSFRNWLCGAKVNPEFNVLPLSEGHARFAFAHDHLTRFSQRGRVEFNFVSMLMHNSLLPGVDIDEPLAKYTEGISEDGTPTYTRVFKEVFKKSMSWIPLYNLKNAILMAFFILKETPDDYNLALIVAGMLGAGWPINRELLTEHHSCLPHLCSCVGDAAALHECLPDLPTAWNPGNAEMIGIMNSSVQLCCDGGHHEALNVLLAKCPRKVDINPTDEKGITALHRAAFAGHVGCVRILLGHPNKLRTTAVMNGAGGGVTALYLACKFGHVDVVDCLMREKETNSVINMFDKEEGMNCLSAAAAAGHEAVVKMLVGSPLVDVGARNSVGVSARQRAEEGGWDECATLLREAEEKIEKSKAGKNGGKKKKKK
jgi:Ca2+-binding EF-hand superfamily protein